MTVPARVLVISTQGLERLVPALGSMAALRAAHDTAKITLLTAPATAAFAGASPYFNEVWTDDTLETPGLRTHFSVRAKLRGGAFDRIYDFDCSPHTRRLFWLMYGWQGLPFNRSRISWSGTIPGPALFHDEPRRQAMHLIDRWASQLRAAGVYGVLRSDLSWIARQVRSFNVPFRMNEPFVLLSVDPGPGSFWPPERFAELAETLAGEDRVPVLVGFAPVSEAVAAVRQACPAAVDLTGNTSVGDLVFLTWAATAAFGLDNGAMHLAAAAGCPSVVLYDLASDPALVGQRGDAVTILRRPQLADVPLGEVVAALRRGRRERVGARRTPVA